MLYSFQTSLPRLPVPAVKDTVNRVGEAWARGDAHCASLGRNSVYDVTVIVS